MNGKDRQILFSKKQIIDAAFLLLENNRFEELTVNEIINQAQISRRTFYRYFSNKEAVLDSYFDSLLAEYSLLKKDILSQNSFSHLLEVTLTFFQNHKKRLQLIIRNHKFHFLLEKFNQLSLTIYREIDAPWHIKENRDEHLIEYPLHFIVGGYSNIISYWLMEENPRSAAEISVSISQLYQNVSQTFDDLIPPSSASKSRR